jgi:RNA polymerase sigma-70 factor, ECF subfamily
LRTGSEACARTLSPFIRRLFPKITQTQPRVSARWPAQPCIIAIIVQRKSFDEEYVRRLIQSDPETESDFVSYFGELLAIKLHSRLRAPELIQDVTQETFLRVLRTLRQSGIDSPEALGSFVNSVCTNVLFEVYRAQSRVAGPVEDRVSEEVPADAAMAGEEERTQVRSVLSELPEKDRKILRWLFFDERDKGEVCRALQVDREYLRVLVHRAKQRFRTGYLRRVATKVNPATPMG